MAAPTIGRRRGWTPRAATVDWSHPLAAGLKFYTMPGVSSSDLVDGSTSTAVAGQVFRNSQTRFGVGGKPNGATWAQASFPNLGRFDVPTGGGSTIFICGGNGPQGQGILEIRGTTPINAFGQYGGADSITFRTRNDANSLDDLVATSAGVDTKIVCASGVWAAGAKSLYVDNKAPVTSSSSGSITGITTAYIFGDTFSVGPTTLVVVAFWNRALSAGEVAQLHADPFAMLRY